MSKKKKLSLAAQIFIGLFLGIIAGFIFLAAGKAEWAVAYVKPFGTIILNLITQTSHIKKWVRTLKNQYFSSQNSNYAAHSPYNMAFCIYFGSL